jgi:hypothetical protein
MICCPCQGGGKRREPSAIRKSCRDQLPLRLPASQAAQETPKSTKSGGSTSFDKGRSRLVRRGTKGDEALRSATIARPNDERNHRAEKRKDDYEDNGFHTSCL